MTDEEARARLNDQFDDFLNNLQEAFVDALIGALHACSGAKQLMGTNLESVTWHNGASIHIGINLVFEKKGAHGEPGVN